MLMFHITQAGASWKLRCALEVQADFDHDPDIPGSTHRRPYGEAKRWPFMAREDTVTEPFFLNYWMFSVHAPFDAKRDLIAKYRKVVAESDRKDPQRCPTYAAMIESMDDAVGSLLSCIDELGISDRTIIVFASDNGGNMYNEVEGVPPTSNTPLRGGKATMFEGGIRGPCIVTWPGKVEPKSRSAAHVQSCDFYPTLLQMTGLSPDEGQKFDGVSIVPALLKQPFRRDPIVTYFPHQPRVPDWLPPSVSVHEGDWKLIRIFHGGKDGEHRWKLFDLAKDQGEANDVSSEHPDVVQRLDALIEKHLVDCNAVRPIANPSFDPQNIDRIWKVSLRRSAPRQHRRVSRERPRRGSVNSSSVGLQVRRRGWRLVRGN